MFGVAMLGSMGCLPLFGGVYGDCGGPQAQDCADARNGLMVDAFAWCGTWLLLGRWLAGRPKP